MIAYLPANASRNPFVAAVSLNEKGHSLRLKFTQVAGFTRGGIKQGAQAHLAAGLIAISDRLGCFAALPAWSMKAIPAPAHRRGQAQAERRARVLKTTLAGTHHAFKHRKYAQHDLSAFVYRINRRFDLHGGGAVPLQYGGWREQWPSWGRSTSRQAVEPVGIGHGQPLMAAELPLLDGVHGLDAPR